MTPLRLPVIERHKVSSLKPWAQNPRDHSPEQLSRLGKSVDAFGLARLPVVQAGTLRILAGHGLWETLMDGGHGAEVIPVIVVSLSDEDAEAYTLADNRLGELSEWHLLDLRESLVGLDDGEREMLALGWSEDELAKLFGPLTDAPDCEGGEAPEEEPEPQILEIWIYPDKTAKVFDPMAKRQDPLVLGIQSAVETLLMGWSTK